MKLKDHLKEEIIWYLHHPFLCLMWALWIFSIIFAVIEHFSES